MTWCVVCRLNGKNKQATFNKPNLKARYCKGCKTDDMVNVVSPRCVSCNKIPNFNHPIETKGKYCADHRLEGMIDVMHRKCFNFDCDKQPAYNYPNESKGLYCAKHKLDGMVNVVSRRCVSCDKQPTYNHPNETKGKYCVEHKLEGMVDVKSRKCLICTKQPTFNYPNETKGKYCVEHKLEGMIDVQNPKCDSCNLFRVYKRPFLCVYCSPDSSKRQKTSEMELYDFLTEHKIEFTHNKSAGFVCGNYRPDFLIDCDTHFIVIENDEHQHTSYPKECEEARMFNIEQSLGLRTHFIRYNPDSYKVNGVTQRIKRRDRMRRVLERVETLRTTIPTEDRLYVEYLYYDH